MNDLTMNDPTMNPLATGIYHAEILETWRDSHAQRLHGLLEQPAYQTLDSLQAQIRDLVQTRQPSRKMDAGELETAVQEFLTGKGGDYGSWAHYPWSRRLVRVLPEDDFVELRTNRNQQKITAPEQARLARKKVGIVGLSVGQSVALTLALERACGEIRLADFDVIDLSNLNRLRCGIHNIGLPKTVVAAREIAEFDPYLRVACFSDGYTEDMAEAFLDGLDVLVDECDSLDVKLRMREAARRRGIPVLMNTSDRGMTDIERFDREPDRPLFHGRLKDISPEALEGLSTEEKIPIVLDIIGLSTSSVRLRASMLEIEQSIKTWPQLASDVTLGGAIICDVARRLLLDEPIASGRYYVDLRDVGASAMPLQPAVAAPSTAPAAGVRENERGNDQRDAFDRIIDDAMLAPSAGNAQPWRWVKEADGLTLRHRSVNRGSKLDYAGKAGMVGMGATLESAVISASQHGYRADVVVFPRGDTVASLALSEQGFSGTEPLHAQLGRRRSVRDRPKVVRDVPESVFDALEAQVERYPGLNLAYLRDRERIEALAAVAGDAERLRMLDPEAHAELVREIAWSDSEHRQTGEGLPIASLSLSAAEAAGFQILRDPAVIERLAEWNLGQGLAKLTRELVSSSSAIGLLWSDTSTQMDYLSGGRALQRLWLEATRADVGLCPMATLCYMLGAWRAGRSLGTMQDEALPAIDDRFRSIFQLPATRGDITLFRMLPAAELLNRPRSTFRRTSGA